MKPLISIFFAVTLASLVGCDEDKQAPGNSAQPTTSAAASPAAPASSSANPPQLLSDLRAAAAPSSSPENDPGRVTFDGDKTQARSLTVPGAVFAGNSTPGSQPKTAYTAPGKGDTLTVSEPPSPGGSSSQPRPFSIASARAGGDATTLKNGQLSGKDEATPDMITGATRTGGRAPLSCPQGMSLIEGYCIDKYEGSLES